MKHIRFAVWMALATALAATARAQDAPPQPPSELTSADFPGDGGETDIMPWLPLKLSPLLGDGGETVVLRWKLSIDDDPTKEPNPIKGYEIRRSEELGGRFDALGFVVPTLRDYERGYVIYVQNKCERGEPYYFRVAAVTSDDVASTAVQVGPVTPVREWFNLQRLPLACIVFVLCGAVIGWILYARSGKPLNVRKIAGLEAVSEAVGRATEMGRSCLFVPGTMDMNDIQTIAGLTVLSNVAKTAAEYGATVEVPTSRSLVMTAARETVEAAFLSAGRPDSYGEELIYYVTDEQFGYVAFVTGKMVRDKPATCFYMGSFYAESLILAETGNSIGAIQVAGTAQPSQLPFFVAACDYTLIGEEFFAASAYLSGEPAQLGSLKGQDMGKLFAGALLIVGIGLATAVALTGSETLARFLHILTETILT